MAEEDSTITPCPHCGSELVITVRARDIQVSVTKLGVDIDVSVQRT